MPTQQSHESSPSEADAFRFVATGNTGTDMQVPSAGPWASRTRRAVILCVLAATVLPLGGCFYGPGPGGWCYYHPYRCN